MASVVAPRRRGLHGGAWIRGLRPAEGWTTVALHLVLVLSAAWSIQRADWDEGLRILPVVAAVATLVGLGLAKTTVPDVIAHLVAFGVGVGFVAVQVASVSEQLGADRRARLLALWDRAERWWDLNMEGGQSDDRYLFVVLLGVTVWLVAYMSAWTLFRRRWLMASVLLPGFVIMINLGYSPDDGSGPLVVYLVAACTLSARHFAFRRQEEWSRFHIPAPERLPWRFLGVGANVALAVVLLAWTLPTNAGGDALDAAWERVDGRWETVERQWERWFGSLSGSNGNSGGSYSAFRDAFELGGPLNLSDDPVIALQAEDPAYLVGRRYDRYDGRGWRSDVERTFDERGVDGGRYSPQMTFQPKQNVSLSPEVTQARAEVAGELTVLQPKGDLLLTLETYEESDQPTSVQLSWRQLEGERFVLGEDDAALPPDLLGLADLLGQATFAPGPDGEPVITDPGLAARVEAEQATQRGRFLRTRWTVGDDGAVTLSVSGQVPVYDDVEAVFGREPVGVGAAYEVEGLQSTASPGQLRVAGTDYPDYVRDRYLQLPTTITDRTRDLAAAVAEGEDNPFDIATAIQNEVRARITYEENIKAPPDDQDVVDYVLFDSKEGYCEYYASAMAVMVRSLDIPARVAVGYYPVPYDDGTGAYVYRERNAHAWVEVYFPKYGWVPFEPTASRPLIEYGSDRPQATSDPAPTPTPTPTPASTPATGAESTPVPPATTESGQQPSLLERTQKNVGMLSALVVFALAALALAAVGAWRWGLRGLSPAASLYARAVRMGRWLGVRPTPVMTPAEYAAEIGRAVPAAGTPARLVADLYAAERYGGRPVLPSAEGRFAWRQLRRALLRSKLLRRRS